MFTSITGMVSRLRVSGFFHIFFSNILNMAIAFVTGIILVRVLSKSDYGIYSYANNVFSIFIIFNGLGATSAALQLCSETDDKAKRDALSNFGYLFGAKFSFLLCLIILFVAAFIPLPVDGSSQLLGFLFLLPLFIFLNEMQKVVLRSELRNSQYAYSNIVATFFILVGTVAGAFLWSTTGLIIGRYLAVLMSIIVVAVVFHSLPRRKAQKASRDEKKPFRRIALVSSLNNGLGELTYLIGTFIVGIALSTSEAVAVYQVATMIPIALNFIPLSIVVFIYPYFARNKENHLWVWKNYKRVMAVTMIICIALSLFCIIGASLIIKIVFGAQYLEAVPPFRILMAGFALASSLRLISGNLLVTQRKLLFNSVVAGGSILLLVALNIILVPKYGIVGASVAQATMLVLSGCASTVYFAKLVRRSNC